MELTDEARQRLEESRIAAGQTLVLTLSRIVQWFADQPPPVQEAILLQKDAAAELVRLKMAEMAAAGDPLAGSTLTLSQATTALRVLADRIDTIDASQNQTREPQLAARHMGKTPKTPNPYPKS